MSQKENLNSITREEFNNYCREMWKKLKEGEKKYGTNYKVMNIQKELTDELVDVANYSFMVWLRVKNLLIKLEEVKK